VFNDLRWEVVVCFVDICGIVYHHCLNFLFIFLYIYSHCLILSYIPHIQVLFLFGFKEYTFIAIFHFTDLKEERKEKI
jgi:hypothetical protein